MKVVINTCYGGYSLSKAAYDKLNLKWDKFGYEYEEDRANPKLVKVVEELGDKADGSCAELKIVNIPDNIEWTIKEYDGVEWVAEKHRTWS